MDMKLRDYIANDGGRITLAQFMEFALYDPDHGYYMSAERKPGRGGDFLTSPEASPLFGITLARQMVEFWERLGSPERFDIREYGSGVGGLAYDILAGIDRESAVCFDATTYHLVERNPFRQAEALAAFREVGLEHKVFDDVQQGQKPITGVILANEVADAFPAHRLEYTGEGFREHVVAYVGDELQWETAPVSDGGKRAIKQLQEGGIQPVEGGIYDVSPAASDWFVEATLSLNRGFAMIIDYGYPARELYCGHRLNGTLRGYYGHTVTDDPFQHVGEQDLTIHVDFSALEQAGLGAGLAAAGLTTQGAALASLGLGDFLVEMQREVDTSMDEYLATQAVVRRLIDPGGLGRFRILVMAKCAPINPPLRLFAVQPPSF